MNAVLSGLLKCHPVSVASCWMVCATWRGVTTELVWVGWKVLTVHVFMVQIWILARQAESVQLRLKLIIFIKFEWKFCLFPSQTGDRNQNQVAHCNWPQSFAVVWNLHNKAQWQSCLKDYVCSNVSDIIYNVCTIHTTCNSLILLLTTNYS